MIRFTEIIELSMDGFKLKLIENFSYSMINFVVIASQHLICFVA